MRTSLSKFSTIVRKIIQHAALRVAFAIGSLVAPQMTIRRAARLFCTPFAASRRRALASPVRDACEEMLAVDGVQLALYVWGDPREQPYVLFAHGWSSHGTRVAPWVAPLREAGYAVVAFDQQAHGKSDGSRSTLLDFVCDLLAVGRRYGPAAAVLGHSLGAAAAAIALANGLQAERAVLIAPPADPLAMAEQFARMIGMARHLARRMFALFERRMRFAVEDLQAHHVVPHIARPALIVHDLEDREVPWSEGERYARFWRNSRLLTTTGLGHHRIADDDGVIRAALRFLRGEPVGDRVVSSPNLPYGWA